MLNILNNLDLYDNKTQLISQLRSNLESVDCVFLCIGSDKVTGDCLGPLTGQLLTQNYNVNAYVYGTLEQPITAQNLISAERFIRKKHKRCKVVAIDASLGQVSDIGCIKMQNRGIFPGSAANQSLPSIGDYSITATVNAGNAMDSSLLFSTRLCFVYKLANTIATAIADFVKERTANPLCNKD